MSVRSPMLFVPYSNRGGLPLEICSAGSIPSLLAFSQRPALKSRPVSCLIFVFTPLGHRRTLDSEHDGVLQVLVLNQRRAIVRLQTGVRNGFTRGAVTIDSERIRVLIVLSPVSWLQLRRRYAQSVSVTFVQRHRHCATNPRCASALRPVSLAR